MRSGFFEGRPDFQDCHVQCVTFHGKGWFGVDGEVGEVFSVIVYRGPVVAVEIGFLDIAGEELSDFPNELNGSAPGCYDDKVPGVDVLDGFDHVETVFV